MNLKSLRNKIEALEFLINNKSDVFLVSGSKLDATFLEAQFKNPVERFLFRIEIRRGFMFCINKNIPCKKIEIFQIVSSIEIFILEINPRKEKLLIFGT